jgi:hypothetical protein
MGRSLGVLRSGSPLVGIFGAIAVMALLLLLAYEFRSPTSETPATAGSLPPVSGPQPVPK